MNASLLRLLPFALVVLAVAASNPAQAAFPGKDGKIAFGLRPNGTGMTDVYSMNADGTNPVDLSNNSAFDGLPAWSPDGRQIAFMSERDANDEIYLMNADGSGQTRVTNDPAHDTNPTWTSDGRIVFDHYTGSSACGSGGDIFIVNADGSGLRNLTNNAGGNCFANVSATGKIVFTSFRDGNGELYSMNADGSGLTRITNSPTCELEPDWSPDGKKLVFLRDLTVGCVGDNDIYTMNADGTGESRLTTTPSRGESFSRWSPQGDRVLFSTGGQIYVMNASGSGETAVAPGSTPTWQSIPKENQTISFNPLQNRTYGDPDFTIQAAASSGLPLSFSASGNCTVTASTVHLSGIGPCTITASQPGDANYNVAPEVTQTFLIAAPKCLVPKVVGKTLPGAKAMLKAKHCGTGKVTKAYSKTTRRGRVSGQSKRPGQVLPGGTKVNLLLSKGRKR